MLLKSIVLSDFASWGMQRLGGRGAVAERVRDGELVSGEKSEERWMVRLGWWWDVRSALVTFSPQMVADDHFCKKEKRWRFIMDYMGR